MDKKRIKSLLHEAETYRAHGLLEDSRGKYLAVLQWAQGRVGFSGHDKLIHSVEGRIRAIECEIEDLDRMTETPELTEDVQDLIRNLFSFSDNGDMAAIEGAVSLAEFGQYEKAVKELQNLIEEGVLPVTAAKNMLRCHLAYASPKEAVVQFNKWVSGEHFSHKELDALRDFYLKTLKTIRQKASPETGHFVISEGDEIPASENAGTETGREQASNVSSGKTFSRRHPSADRKMTAAGEAAEQTGTSRIDGASGSVGSLEKSVVSEEVLEIYLIGITLDCGPRKGETVEFDITFQSGNTISFVIQAIETDLINYFKPGSRLPAINCFSPVSVFHATGTVAERKEIATGPKRGDYAFRLILDSL